nr:cardioactive peptide [Aplysia sp.]
MNYLAFPRM